MSIQNFPMALEEIVGFEFLAFEHDRAPLSVIGPHLVIRDVFKAIPLRPHFF